MSRIVTRGSRALVRSGPGSSFGVVGSRSSGDSVEVAERRDGWARIGTGQWVDADLISEDGEAGSDVIAHPGRPDDSRWRLLINFATNSAELTREHRRWLSGYAAQQARQGQHVWLRGFASRLGRGGHNLALSQRRASAVRDYLTGTCRISASQITGVSAVGEEWSSGSDTDDSGRWRAVEVIITSGPVELPSTHIRGANPLSTRFFIKYVGGGGGGEGLQLDVATFVIRTPNGYWQRYIYGGGGASASFPPIPGAWADPLPPGRGWVEFTTRTPVTVSDFAGMARLAQAGAVAGDVSIGTYQLGIQNATDLIEVPTGTGQVSVGVSWTIGALEPAGRDHHDSNWTIY